MKRSRFTGLVVLAALVGLVMVGLSSPASSFGAAGVRVVAPAEDALIGIGDGTVAIRIVAPRRAGAVRAEFEQIGRAKAIPVKLHRAGGELRGQISRRALGAGRQHLFVYSKRVGRIPAASSHFTVGRGKGGMLKLQGGSSPNRTAVRFRAKVPRDADFRAALNGRSVTGEFTRRGTHVSVRLGADDGLRFGRNRLVMTAFDRQSGDYQTQVRDFRIGRDRPMVGAGRDRVVSAGPRLRLDGTSTRAGHGKLRLRWRIAAAPRGSKAKLAGARTERPSLLGARPGRYRIALHATQGAGHGARASASAVAGASAEATGAGGSDSTEVCVQPDVLPEGVPIETLGSSTSPSVKVGAAVYPMANPSSSFAQVVILDRCSLAEISNRSYAESELEKMTAAIFAATKDQLVIVSGGGASISAANPETPMLVGALNGIGVEFGPGVGEFEQFSSGDFSLIGIPGLPEGEATQMIGASPGNAPDGQIEGFLRLDSSGNFTFNWPASDRVPFELGSGTTATRNTITIGNQSYSQELSGEAGFHLVWVARANLRLLGQETVGVNVQGMGAMAARLELAREEDALVFVSSYGSPNLVLPGDEPMMPVLSATAKALENFGANPYALLGLNGQGGYSFIGLNGSTEVEGPNSGVELVQAEAGTPTNRITGELTRSPQGNWLPSNNGSPESLTTEPLGHSILAKILGQPLQPFKPLSLPVQEYIYAKLFATKAEPKLDPTFGLRRFYWAGGNDYDSAGFAGLKGDLAELAPCTARPCVTEFAAVKKTLLEEFKDVSTVKRFFEDEGEQGTIAHIFSRATGGNGAVFTGVQQYIDGLYGNPEGEPSHEEAEYIYSGVLTVGEGVAGVLPVGGDEISTDLTIVQGVSEMVEGLAKDEDGGSVYNPDTVKVDALEWAEQVKGLVEAGFTGMHKASNLFVSDEGRLRTMVELLKTESKNGGLDFGGPEEQTMKVGIERAEQRYMWKTMLPIAVQAATPFSGPFNSPLPATGPASEQGVAEVNAAVGSQPNGKVLYGYDIAPYEIVDGFDLPSEATAKLLFGPIESGQSTASGPLGFRPKYLLTPAAKLAGGVSSAGLKAGLACQQESIDNYEVDHEEQEYDPHGGGFIVKYVNCKEAEPPYSGRYVLSHKVG